MTFIKQDHRNRGGGGGGEGVAVAPQILAKIDLLPIDTDSE